LTDGDVMTVQKIVDRFEEMLRDEKLKKEIDEFVKKSSRATSEELDREFTI
jgi:tripartite-type tricarboxylate transporter receptor subunit TctC